MTQVADDPIQAGREAVQRRAWEEGYELLKAAADAGDLTGHDFELLAEAALWNGKGEEEPAHLERAFRVYTEEDNRVRAAYIAVMLAHIYKNQLQASVANGWLSRAKRLLDDQPEAAEHGYYALQASLMAAGENDFDEAYALGKQAEEIGRRFADRSLEIRGIQRQGSALIQKGDVSEGKLLLDEASAAALSGELDPYSTLVVYCNTIGACRDVADFDSAGEWTDRAHEFCESNSMSAFPGMCRVNYAEVMKYKGRLTEAGELANRASEELRAWCPRIAGAAFYELGEVRLRLGDLAQAEQAFREADEFGKNPEPGLSLLRLAKGNAKAAFASIRRELGDETLGVAARARLLPAAVEIAVAASELESAGMYADGLGEASRIFDTSALKAEAAFARGSVRFAQGDTAAAFACFRQARTFWDATGATYDSARARERLGLTARADGDEDTAIWELEAAAARFERLGAVRDAERVGDLLVRDVGEAVMKTFLFTDIVRSTDLLATIEDRHWANALRRHDDTLRLVFADHGGEVVDHTGDGFFAAFEEGVQALQAAIAIQRAVDQEFVFDLRIGVHTDGALHRAENYRGKGVHAAARIGAAAAGQEILVSAATMKGLDQFKSSNERAIVLKGFKEPVEVCSVEWR
jgi:class 3 adenylate cyclase